MLTSLKENVIIFLLILAIFHALMFVITARPLLMAFAFGRRYICKFFSKGNRRILEEHQIPKWKANHFSLSFLCLFCSCFSQHTIFSVSTTDTINAFVFYGERHIPDQADYQLPSLSAQICLEHYKRKSLEYRFQSFNIACISAIKFCKVFKNDEKVGFQNFSLCILHSIFTFFTNIFLISKSEV